MICRLGAPESFDRDRFCALYFTEIDQGIGDKCTKNHAWIRRPSGTLFVQFGCFQRQALLKKFHSSRESADFMVDNSHVMQRRESQCRVANTL